MKKIYPLLQGIVHPSQLKQTAAAPAIVFFVRMLFIITPIVIVTPFKLFAQAPTVSYNGPQMYPAATAITPLAPTSSGVAVAGYGNVVNFGSGLNIPFFVAADAAGNVYVSDVGNHAVYKFPVGGAPRVTLATSFGTPAGVAVDTAGNVYVADQGNGRIRKIPVGGGAPVAIGPQFAQPFGVAVDGAGNVYVADDGQSAVMEIPVGGGATVTLASGVGAEGIAVDLAGNVYVAGHGSGVITKISAGGGPLITLASGFLSPVGLAIDGGGNVYVADQGHNAVKVLPPGGGSPVTIGSAIAGGGVAIDGAGNVYAVDLSLQKVKEISPVGGYFISPFLPVGLSFDSVTGIISGTPANISSPSRDYSITAYNSSGATVAKVNITVNPIPLPVISYSGPQTYAIGTAITPLTPTGSGVAAPGYASPVNFGLGLGIPFFVAADTAGNVYVSDVGNHAVYKFPVGGGARVTLASFNTPAGVAVDLAGNVYVADQGNGRVTKIPVGGGAPVAIGPQFAQPFGVAVDTAGNVYVADDGTSAIREIPVGGGSLVTLVSGVGAEGIAVDLAGNVYVAGHGSGVITKIPAGGGPSITLGSGYFSPVGIAIDGAGNVYVADQGHNAVKVIPPGGGSPVTIGSAIAGGGVAVDAAGNVYAVDLSLQKVREISPLGGYFISPSLPVGLSFDGSTGTISGTPTMISPAKNYTVTGYNSGGISRQATVNINVALSSDADLTNLTINHNASFTTAFTPGQLTYTANVPYSTNEISITPACDTTATVKVNNIAVSSGTASQRFALNVGNNTITTVVTAQDSATIKTYTVTVIRAPSSNDLLSSINLRPYAALTLVAGPDFKNFTASVNYNVTSVSVIAKAADPAATITVNGLPATSGTASTPVPLNIGPNAIAVVVLAADGVSSKTYTITVTRALSANANLSNLKINNGNIALTPAFNYNTTSYTASVTNAATSIKVIPTTSDANARAKINGIAVASGTQSASLPLATGPNTITSIVTAQDGIATKTYTIIITRATGSLADPLVRVSVEKPIGSPGIEGDGITVYQGISPNGDGQNDFLMIEGIANYPDNKLTIVNRNGTLVYEAKGYDNSARVFDGHSNKTGVKQLPGTYFYSLAYKVKGLVKYKTGFIVLKY